MAGGSDILDKDGKIFLDTDGNDFVSDDTDKCPPYELLNCADATSSGIGLRDADNTDIAITGDVVLYSVDSKCYTLGCRKCGLTPTAGGAAKKTGCGDAACGLYALTPCCGGSPTIGLRLVDKPESSSIGSTIADPSTGLCYTIGALTASPLTPTVGPWRSISTDCTSGDCPPCSDPCGCCGFARSITVTIAGITVCPCWTVTSVIDHSENVVGSPNGTYTLYNSVDSPCTFRALIPVFLHIYFSNDCTGATDVQIQFELAVIISCGEDDVSIYGSISNVATILFSSGAHSTSFSVDACAAHGPFVLAANPVFGCYGESFPYSGHGGTMTVTP